MRKILILLVLCLGVLGFSASKTSREVAKKVDTVPGFEKLIWGMSKDEVINKLGEPKFNFDKILTYENLEFVIVDDGSNEKCVLIYSATFRFSASDKENLS